MTTPQEPTVKAERPKKAADKSGRTRAREFALQALYQHLVGKNEAADIDLFTRDLSGFHTADSAHYDALQHGSIAHVDAPQSSLCAFLLLHTAAAKTQSQTNFKLKPTIPSPFQSRDNNCNRTQVQR